MSRAFIVQQPRDAANFDMAALEKIGVPTPILPAAPNIHDADRIARDLSKLRDAVANAKPDDIFVTMGGAPLSNMLFGAAIALEGVPVRMGLYSRHQDEDGRRGQATGSYRVIEVKL